MRLGQWLGTGPEVGHGGIARTNMSSLAKPGPLTLYSSLRSSPERSQARPRCQLLNFYEHGLFRSKAIIQSDPDRARLHRMEVEIADTLGRFTR